MKKSSQEQFYEVTFQDLVDSFILSHYEEFAVVHYAPHVAAFE